MRRMSGRWSAEGNILSPAMAHRLLPLLLAVMIYPRPVCAWQELTRTALA